ncbi:MAG: flagellar hook-length control protein FliK [Paracoccaceae bacterium]
MTELSQTQTTPVPGATKPARTGTQGGPEGSSRFGESYDAAGSDGEGEGGNIRENPKAAGRATAPVNEEPDLSDLLEDGGAIAAPATPQAPSGQTGPSGSDVGASPHMAVAPDEAAKASEATESPGDERAQAQAMPAPPAEMAEPLARAVVPAETAGMKATDASSGGTAETAMAPLGMAGISPNDTAQSPKAAQALPPGSSIVAAGGFDGGPTAAPERAAIETGRPVAPLPGAAPARAETPGPVDAQAPVAPATEAVLPQGPSRHGDGRQPETGVMAALLRTDDSDEADSPGMAIVRGEPGAAPTGTASQGRGMAVPAGDVAPVLRQIAAAVEVAGDGRIDLALSPKELGKVQITLAHDGNTVAITVAADRPETLELLRRHASELAREMIDIGYSGASFAFNQNPRNQPQGEPAAFAVEETKAGAAARTDGIAVQTAMSAPLRLATAGDGLDIRL